MGDTGQVPVPGCDRDPTMEPGARPMRTRHSTFLMRPVLVLWAALVAGAGLVAAPAFGGSTPAAAAAAATARAGAKPALVYGHLALLNGSWAQVYSDGLAEVFRPRAGSRSMMASAV